MPLPPELIAAHDRMQLLFEIDPSPFQAVLDQAKGQLAQAKAMLANAQAVQRRTELDVNRYTALAQEKAASQPLVASIIYIPLLFLLMSLPRG